MPARGTDTAEASTAAQVSGRSVPGATVSMIATIVSDHLAAIMIGGSGRSTTGVDSGPLTVNAALLADSVAEQWVRAGVSAAAAPVALAAVDSEAGTAEEGSTAEAAVDFEAGTAEVGSTAEAADMAVEAIARASRHS